MIDKLRDCFDEMVVYKDLRKSNFFSALGLPSFLRDWLLKKFADEEGNLDLDALTDFIHTYLPIAFFKIKAHIHMNETTLNSQKAKHSERRVESHWEEHPMTLP